MKLNPDDFSEVYSSGYRAKVLAFDLDGTLAPSKGRVESRLSIVLSELLEKFEIYIITGGGLEQIKRQVIDTLPAGSKLERLNLMPTCGAAYYKFEGEDWVEIYRLAIDEIGRSKLAASIEECARQLGYWVEESYGPLIEDRVSQITYSALGQNAPVEVKESWDKDNYKKIALRDKLSALHPEYSIRTGGATSIDITIKGIDKAYAIREISKLTNVKQEEILYFGDRFNPEGNDYPVSTTMANYVEVMDHNYTYNVLNNLLKLDRDNYEQN